MADSSFGLPTINDMNLQGKSMINTDWAHQTIIQYEIGDVCTANLKWYQCVKQADASVDATRIPRRYKVLG